jgi:PadR family transcriptional regulator AphA
MPGEHAVLALLALAGGTGHGYDLARQFQAGQALGDVLRLEPSMLYHHLKKLERNDWVTTTVEPQGSRPPRQVHTLTDAGRAEVEGWLIEPVQRTREIRLDFLVKLYFARRLASDSVPTLIDRQRTVLAEALHRLQEQAAGQTGDEDAAFARDVLDLRERQTQAAMDWLDELATLTTDVRDAIPD